MGWITPHFLCAFGVRMSPDYLVIGEVRDGMAAMSLFGTLMTGHSGACTFHADSPREAARRPATVMGADAGVKPHEANQMIFDSWKSRSAE
jgi:pilus assembly protein CpaF